MNKSQTKRALLMSVVSMLLCCTMLIGTTFAWFTDSVTSGVNQIVAGNLDIELYNDVKINSDAKVDNMTDLFQPEGKNTLWEPGAVAYENFTISNEGTLALKYAFSLNVAENAPLAKALKVGVIEGGVAAAEGETLTREGVLAKVSAESWKTLQSYTRNGKLYSAAEAAADAEKPATETFAIVIWWEPTDADNEFNMNNENKGKTLSIDLGVKLLATQVENESDNFGTDYDKDATYTVSVSTPDGLVDAIKDAKDGDTIVLSENVVLTDLAQSGDKEITIDLAGNALTLGSADGAKDGLTVSKGATLNLVNSGEEKTTLTYLGANTRYDAIFVEKGTLNIGGNIDVVVSPEASSVIHATEGSVVNIGEGTNIVVKGETDNQFPAVFIERNATVNMTGGSILVESNLTVADDGWNNDAVGIVLRGANAAFNMTGGEIIVRSKNAMAQGIQIATENGVGSCTVNIDGGVIEVSNVGDQGGSYAFAFFDTRVGEINVTDATFKGTYTAVVMEPAIGEPEDANVNITGGTYAFDPSAYATGCKVTDNGDGTYTVKQLYSVEGNTVTLIEKEALADVIAYAKAKDEAVTIQLPAAEFDTTPEIYLNWGAYEISLIGATNEDGTPATTFNVTANAYWGLKGTVQNIVFKDTTNSKIVKFMDGNGLNADVVVDNCLFDGASMQFTGVATVKNCVFDGNDAAWSGIQYSAPGGDILIEDCKFSGYCFTNLQVTDEGAHKALTVTVRGCTVGELSENAVSYAEGVTLYVDTIVLEGNTFDCDVWTPSFATVTKTENITSENGEVTYKNW